jgi:hypothetical protein
MAASDLTGLEAALLERILTKSLTLPCVSQLEVRSRKNTGAGRFTYLGWSGNPSPEPHIISPPHSISMEGVEAAGLGVVVFVDPQELMLELFTYVGDWDGTERSWSISELVDDR